MVPGCLLDVNDDVVIESALCAGGLMGGEGWLGLEAQYCVGIVFALGLGEVGPGVVSAEFFHGGFVGGRFLTIPCAWLQFPTCSSPGGSWPAIPEAWGERPWSTHRPSPEDTTETPQDQRRSRRRGLVAQTFRKQDALQFTSVLQWTGERQVLYICQSEIFPVHYFAISTMNACSIEL